MAGSHPSMAAPEGLSDRSAATIDWGFVDFGTATATATGGVVAFGLLRLEPVLVRVQVLRPAEELFHQLRRVLAPAGHQHLLSVGASGLGV